MTIHEKLSYQATLQTVSRLTLEADAHDHRTAIEASRHRVERYEGRIDDDDANAIARELLAEAYSDLADAHLKLACVLGERAARERSPR
jgi:hypothetical protein